jgi:hypothetical protein
MTAKSIFDLLPKVISFFWGFAFIHLFKYNLEKIYPHWNESLGLSFFAYTLFFIAWAAYTFSFFYKKEKFRLFSLIIHSIFFINSGIFLFIVANYGENFYLYTYPLLFNFQMGVFIFLFITTMRLIIGYRISLLGGILAGLLSYPYIGNIYIDILLPVFLYLLTTFIIPEKKKIISGNYLRMAVLRESLDFLRYFFLGLAFFGSFDNFRNHFYLSVFILAIGPLLSFFLLKADKRKHHVKYGISVLALFFLGLAVISNYIHLNFSAAAGFSFLTIWEGIYFKKTSEGYLKREIILSGIALTISLFFYIISMEWVLIISAIIVIFAQIRILNYIAKGYRKAIAVLFLISLTAWSISLYFNYNKSYKRGFFVSLRNTPNPAPPTVNIFGFFTDKTKTYYTNLFPGEFIESMPPQISQNIVFKDIKSPFLIWNISWIHRKNPNAVQIYSLDDLKSYKGSPGIEMLNEYLISNEISNVYFYSKKDQVFTYPMNFQPGLKINSSFLTPEEILKFGKSLALWYIEKKEYDFAVSIYLELLQSFESTNLYRSIANLYGITGNTGGQMEYRQKVYSRPDSTKDDKINLMELYFLFGQNQNAYEICDYLISREPYDISLYEWKYKIIRSRNNRFQLEALKNNLLYLGNFSRLSQEQIFQKDGLINKINDDLKSIPLWNEIFNTEKKRQENIVYPE